MVFVPNSTGDGISTVIQVTFPLNALVILLIAFHTENFDFEFLRASSHLSF